MVTLKATAFVLFTFMLGVIAALSVVLLRQPYCPTEDSCTPDYQSHWYGRVWTGKEQIP